MFQAGDLSVEIYSRADIDEPSAHRVRLGMQLMASKDITNRGDLGLEVSRHWAFMARGGDEMVESDPQVHQHDMNKKKQAPKYDSSTQEALMTFELKQLRQ
jgi:hypothetical protein